jgi:hypothetical protein
VIVSGTATGKEVNPMSHRLKPFLTTLAVTAALAGGGAAIASAASTSTSSSGATSSQSTTGSSHAAPNAAPRGHSGKNCPNM